MSDPWRILGVERGCDEQTALSAYRRLRQKYHPDKARTPELQRRFASKFIEITQAYERIRKDGFPRETESLRNTRPNETSTSARHTPETPRKKSATWWLEMTLGTTWALGSVVSGVVLFYLDPGAEVLAQTDLLRQVIAIVGAVCLASVTGGLFAAMQFLIFAPLFGFFLWCRLESLAFKVPWLLSVCLWAIVIYKLGVPEDTADFLFTWTFWVVSIGWAPVFGLSVWLSDYFKFQRLKKHLPVILSGAV